MTDWKINRELREQNDQLKSELQKCRAFAWYMVVTLSVVSAAIGFFMEGKA